MPTVKKCRCGLYVNRGIAVDAVIIRNGRVLLIQRKAEPEKEKWALPGGMVDWGETTEEACRRELSEETGLVSDTVSLLGVFSSPRRFEQRISIAYLVRAKGRFKKNTSETSSCRWWSIKDLPVKLAFDHGNIIKLAFEKKA